MFLNFLMPCLKCQNLLLKTKMKNRMKRIECTVFIILSKCKQRLPNPIIEEKRACYYSEVPFVFTGCGVFS